MFFCQWRGLQWLAVHTLMSSRAWRSWPSMAAWIFDCRQQKLRSFRTVEAGSWSRSRVPWEPKRYLLGPRSLNLWSIEGSFRDCSLRTWANIIFVIASLEWLLCTLLLILIVCRNSISSCVGMRPRWASFEENQGVAEIFACDSYTMPLYSKFRGPLRYCPLTFLLSLLTFWLEPKI